MIGLDEQLASTARVMTQELEVADPSSPTGRAVRGRRTPWRLAGVAVGAAAAAVALLVWASSSAPPTETVVASQGAGGGAGATASVGTPQRRLQDAVEATLSGEPVVVTVVAVQVDGMLSQDVRSAGAPLPVVVGTGGVDDLAITVDGPLEATGSGTAAGRGVVRMHDDREGRSYWQVGADVWQRATFAEETLAQQLRALAADGCARGASGRDDVVLVSIPAGACVQDPLQAVPGRQEWAVAIGADGRLDRITPVADLADGSSQPRSELDFADGPVRLSLPDASLVTDVPTPWGWGISAETGWAVPTSTRG